MAKIFLVSDDVDFLRKTETVLSDSGHDVRISRNGSSGVTLAADWRPDLMFFELPAVQWVESPGQSRIRIPKELPVVFVSESSRAAESYLSGAVAWTSLSADPGEILRIVDDVFAHPSARPKILIVDDEDSVLAYCRLVLRPKCEVVTAQDGREALEHLRAEEDIRVVITDVQMPGMNGVALVDALRGDERWKSIPVIVQTADQEQAKLESWQGRDVAKVIEKGDFFHWLLELGHGPLARIGRSPAVAPLEHR